MDDARRSRKPTPRTSRPSAPRSPYPETSIPRPDRRERLRSQGAHDAYPRPRELEDVPTTIWTAANYVTFVRVIGTFIWVLCATFMAPDVEGGFSWPIFLLAIFFALIAFTDSLDGYLARSRGEVTDIGKFMDPIADKLICMAALLVLFGWGYLSIWVLVIVLAREFLVAGLRMVVASKGEVVAASTIGKWKTGFTMGAIIGYLVGIALGGGAMATVLLALSWVAMVVAVVLTIWSGVDYLLLCWGYFS